MWTAFFLHLAMQFVWNLHCAYAPARPRAVGAPTDSCNHSSSLGVFCRDLIELFNVEYRRFFCMRLDQIRSSYPLAVIAQCTPRQTVDTTLASIFAHKNRANSLIDDIGLLGLSARFFSLGVSAVGPLHLSICLKAQRLYLEYPFNLDDEALIEPSAG